MSNVDKVLVLKIQEETMVDFTKFQKSTTIQYDFTKFQRILVEKFFFGRFEHLLFLRILTNDICFNYKFVFIQKNICHNKINYFSNLF